MNPKKRITNNIMQLNQKTNLTTIKLVVVFLFYFRHIYAKRIYMFICMIFKSKIMWGLPTIETLSIRPCVDNSPDPIGGRATEFSFLSQAVDRASLTVLQRSLRHSDLLPSS